MERGGAGDRKSGDRQWRDAERRVKKGQKGGAGGQTGSEDLWGYRVPYSRGEGGSIWREWGKGEGNGAEDGCVEFGLCSTVTWPRQGPSL